MQKIIEGKATIEIKTTERINKKMPLFYNPVMSFNRDIAILLLKSISQKSLQIADPLAGTGIRSARFLLELPKNKIKNAALNDANPKFKQAASKLIKQNKLPKNKITLHNEDANLFLLKSTGFDYIDIDPFGSPNHYLDAATKRISREGILAVTATDTSALSGSHENACKRKYWATPLRNELMHEIGIRILARKTQLIGAQYEKALLPIFCHATQHYMRIYFQCKKGKKQADKILKQHLFLLFCNNCRNHLVSRNNSGNCTNCAKPMNFAGQLWAGQLFDEKLVRKMLANAKNSETKKFLNTLLEESKIDSVGFYSLSKICKMLRISMPRKNDIIEKIKKKGFSAAPTHFAGDAIKTNLPLKELLSLLNRSSLKQTNL